MSLLDHYCRKCIPAEEVCFTTTVMMSLLLEKAYERPAHQVIGLNYLQVNGIGSDEKLLRKINAKGIGMCSLSPEPGDPDSEKKSKKCKRKSAN